MANARARKTLRWIAATTIVLMLFAVLGTATYAWYTLASKARISDISLIADSVAAGGDLSISFDPNGSGSEIEFDRIRTALEPMVPRGKLVRANPGAEPPREGTKLANPDGLRFVTTLIREGESVADADGKEAAATPLTGKGGAERSFFLRNGGESAICATVSYSIEIERDAGEEDVLRDKLRIAAFTRKSGSGDEFELFGVMAVSRGAEAQVPAVHWIDEDAEIVAGVTAVTEHDPGTVIRTDRECVVESGKETIALEPGEAREIRLAMWLDGVETLNEHGEKRTAFRMTFGPAGETARRSEGT